jgi:hypothetical protein
VVACQSGIRRISVRGANADLLAGDGQRDHLANRALGLPQLFYRLRTRRGRVLECRWSNPLLQRHRSLSACLQISGPGNSRTIRQACHRWSSPMTDCPIDYRAVRHPVERRRAWAVGIAGLVGLGLLASMFGWHPPEPNECKPGPGPVFTQVVSPTTLQPCFDAGPKQNPR